MYEEDRFGGSTLAADIGEVKFLPSTSVVFGFFIEKILLIREVIVGRNS